MCKRMLVATKIFEIVSSVVCVAVASFYFIARFSKHNMNSVRKNATLAVPPWLAYDWLNVVAFWSIVLVAVLVRFWRFWEIPYGLNQDEASIGYDAFAICKYGYDRNGFHLPIYPIGFGDGHGPLVTYLAMPAIRLLGLSIFSARLTNVVLSCVAAVVFYFLVKRLAKSRSAALIGFGIVATAPILILSARWCHDSSPPPSLFILAMYLFVAAIDSRKTWLYGVSAAFFGLICYSYGPAAAVVIIFLALTYPYLLYHKKITLAQLSACALIFAATVVPMMIFILRNVWDMPPINSFISFPRFTIMRSTNVCRRSFTVKNFIDGINMMIFQPQDYIYNTVPGFGTTYLFTSPLIIFGVIVLALKFKLKTYTHMFLVGAYCIASVVMTGLIAPNVNRISVVYPGVILLIVLSIHAVWQFKRLMSLVLCAFVAVSFALFDHNYFGEKYKNDFGCTFFYSLGDALEYAMSETNGNICVTEKCQREPSIIALFYSKLPPDRFYNTVKYYNPYVATRDAMYFDRFIFRTPREKDVNVVYVVTHAEVPSFDANIFARKIFAYYSVMYPKKR